MKIRVLHVIKSLGRGGAEMLLPETLKIHNKEEFEFHYIYFLPWKNQMVASIESAGGKVTCFKANNNIQLLLQFPKILAYCKKNDIQLIHAHLPWAGFVCRIVHLLSKIPTLYTEHNLQDRYHFITRTLNTLTFNFQNSAIGVSDDVTNSIVKNIQPKISTTTILNGVNTNSFMRNDSIARNAIRKQYSIPENALLVGTVAVFRFQKRLDLWLEIMAEAIQNNHDIYGIIIGAGPLEASLLAKHKALGLEGKVFFTGLQTQVKPFYEAMDVFMMTSSFEGLPIALLEAMSMGCAIITTDAGGIKEVVRNEEDGKLVTVNEWQHLSEKLLLLQRDTIELKRLQEAARSRVEVIFSMQAMVAHLENCYKEHLPC